MKKGKLKKSTLISLVIALVAVLAIIGVFVFTRGGAADPEPEPEPVAEEEPQDEIEEEPEEEEPEEPEEVDPHPGESVNLLTGQYANEYANLFRPVAVMVENTGMALPQYGLNSASVLYECPVEGGITRMMAIFNRGDIQDLDRIGNVRSARPYYIHIANEFDAVFVHYGQSIHAKVLLDTGIIENLSGLDGSVSGTVFYRTSDKSAPHNAYTSGEGINNGIERKGYRSLYREDYPGRFRFINTDETERNWLENGQDCVQIDLYYRNNRPWFVYNIYTGKYMRYQFDGPQVDGLTGEQVEVDNILFQNVPSSTLEATAYLNLPLTGTGAGKFFTSGKMIDITWVKDSDSSITHYYDPEGNEIELNPGRTFVCLIENQYADQNVFHATFEEQHAQ